MSSSPSKDPELAPAEDQIETIPSSPPGYQHNTAGTVKLFEHGSVVLIPTPSPDPKDPLNLPTWHKLLIILLVGLYSAFAVLGTSGLGSVFTSLVALYPPSDSTKATDLLTYPTLFMGVGNLLAMPLSVALGRCPVFLFSLLVLVTASVWCACASSDLNSHIAARDVFSLAAGQSEALAPMIVQEIHFLHEWATRVACFVAVQTVGSAAMFVTTTYLVPGWGLAWWYGIISIVMGIVLIVSYFFVVEKRWDRPGDANEGAVHLKLSPSGPHPSTTTDFDKVIRVTTAASHILEPSRFGPRTWSHTLRIFHFAPDWAFLVRFYLESLQALLVPPILWLMLLNGAYLGVYVYQASTFATILMAPPYSWQSGWLGYVQMVQILDVALMLPLLGWGSDRAVRLLSRWNRGLFEPEFRLVPLVLPAVAVVLGCVLYGQAGAHPERWSWVTVAVTYNLGYFAFLGANMVGITYSVDAFPAKAGPLLLVICAGRGFISFGLSYSTVPFIQRMGYDGAMDVFAIVCGGLSVLGLGMYFVGKRIRAGVGRWLWKVPAEVRERRAESD